MKKIASILVVLLMALVCFTSCSKKAEAPAAAAPSATTAKAASAETPAKKGSDEIVLRIVDWSDSSQNMRKEFHKKFEENHPGVKIDYTCLSIDQFNNTVVTLVKSGDAPDIFPIPSGKTLSMAMKEGWYQPMTPYLTEDFIKTINPNALCQGVTMIGDEIYTLPENAPTIHTVIFYNKTVLEKAGITKLPKTYSEFVETCKKVSEAGNGQFYGWIEGGKQLNRLDILVRAFTSVAGGKIAQNGKVLTVNGRAPYDSPEVIGTMNLFKEIVETGGMHPDTLNIAAPEARELFAQGQAAFLMQGMWCIPTWAETYPDMQYGVMDIPAPDGQSDQLLYGSPADNYAPWLGIYKQSKHPDLAGEYLMCLFSEEYGYEKALAESGNSVSIIPAINEKYMTNPIAKEYYEVAERNQVVIPFATTKDEKAYDFYAEVKDVSPNLANIFQGVISQSIDDATPYLKTLADNSTKEWKRACDAIGLDFSVFEFPNWDLRRDYTSADYAALK